MVIVTGDHSELKGWLYDCVTNMSDFCSYVTSNAVGSLGINWGGI
jgi:hypothetical protein